jgi:hypothetical protein
MPKADYISENRALIMRVNRLLGAALVEQSLIPIEKLEEANDRMLQVIGSGGDSRPSLLSVLIFELKALTETQVLTHLIEEHGLGVVNLKELEIADDVRARIKPGPCWATWSVPFDREDEFWYVATACYLSPAARQHWEKELKGPIVWFATSLESISDFLERAESDTKVSVAS